MILCCGEALIDMLPRETANGEPAFAPHCGGSVFNTAVALGRLGAPVGFVSGLSSDFFGAMLRDTLAESRVEIGLAAISDLPTTLAFVALKDGQPSYAFYDENTAGRMLLPEDIPSLPDDIDALFFGGISLAAEPCGVAYEKLMLRESNARAIMLDPNVRPGFIADESANRIRIGSMIARTDIVKLSDEDLFWMEGPGDAAEQARGMLGMGPSIVCLTEGDNGARAFTAKIEATASAEQVEVVDSVGAGDTFNAGFLASLHDSGMLEKRALRMIDEASLVRALQFGARAAAATVSRAGADPPWASEL